MTRAEFKQVIKAFSLWRVDKRKGNYKLPNGERLSDYLIRLAMAELENHNLGIASNGEIVDVLLRDGNLRLMKPFTDIDEESNASVQTERVITLINEMLN